MKNFYRSIVLFVMALVAVVCLSAQVHAAAGDACNNDADCDDLLFCTGVESCSSEGSICVVGTDPCEASQTCNEAAGTCDGEAECETWVDCDDGDLCTGAICRDGVCDNPPVDCGDDICDPVDGQCVECLVDEDCAVNETCEENLCEEPACPDVPELEFDEDGNCLLSKDELKAMKTHYKDEHKQQKDDLKAAQAADKELMKDAKANYAE